MYSEKFDGSSWCLLTIRNLIMLIQLIENVTKVEAYYSSNTNNCPTAIEYDLPFYRMYVLNYQTIRWQRRKAESAGTLNSCFKQTQTGTRWCVS